MAKQRKFKKSGELKGIKAPNNKGKAYLPSGRTIARKKQRPALHGRQRYPSGLAQVEYESKK